MTRAYLRLDPNLMDHKAAYPDGAFRAFVETLCFAEQQPSRGVFRSRKLLAVLLEKRARWIPYLIDHADLIPMPSGHLVVEGWAEWQEGDWKVAERMHRVRNRTKPTKATVTSDTVATVTDDTVDTVTAPSRAEAVSGKRLAEAAAPRQPGKGRHVQLVDGKYQA
jgi:hypothetical protein